ncbi:MAG: lysoplasmalogenase family protein [Pleomorphochaeta sp.]
MNIIALILFILISIFNIIACNKNKKILIALTKITLAPLALVNVLINSNFNNRIIFLLCLAYALYLIGDILLLSMKTLLFALGLSSFLLGHLTFIFIFTLFNKSYWILLIALVLLIYPEILMFRITKNGQELKIPMRIYSLLMAVFIAFSATTLNPLLIFGTSIFTISDSFIARNNCMKKRIFSDGAIMGTYTLALISLSLGMIIINTL